MKRHAQVAIAALVFVAGYGVFTVGGCIRRDIRVSAECRTLGYRTGEHVVGSDYDICTPLPVSLETARERAREATR